MIHAKCFLKDCKAKLEQIGKTNKMICPNCGAKYELVHGKHLAIMADKREYG